jgi:hypothetical protein
LLAGAGAGGAELNWVKTRSDTEARTPLTDGPVTAAWPCPARTLKLSARTACVVITAAGGTADATAAANRNRSSSISRVGLVGPRPGLVPAAP